MRGWTQPQGGTVASPGCEEAWLPRHPLDDAAPRGASKPKARSAGDPLQALVRTVETEIIPRLMLLHQQAAPRPAAEADGGVGIGEPDVLALTELVLKGQDGASAFVEALMLRGAALETIYLNLLAAVARRLGDLWNADLVEFTDVTIALGRLQRVLRELSADTRAPARDARVGCRALLVPVPGEQHTFGLNMVCEFFRASGWDVWGEPPTQPEALIALVRDHWFDMVGFSIGNDRRIDALAELIRLIRRTSHNRAVRVLVGGPLLLARPQVATLLGADATASDARQAMLATEGLLAKRDEGR
jgi:methanogenic corrinoid protein MtbC1